MNYLFIGLVGTVALLIGIVALMIKVAQKRKEELKRTNAALEAALVDLRKQREYQGKKEEAQQNADTKKSTLHTSDTAADFNNSIELLHGASKNGSR